MKFSAQPKIDCHVHVFDPARFPYAADAWYLPSGAETGTAANLGQVLDAHGVQHALIVGPNSGYGLDNRCLLDALARGAGRYKGVALLALAETGRACVKLSGLTKCSALPYPYPDAWPYVQALLDAYTPQNLVWASDWPFLRAPARIDYGPLLALFEQLLPHAEARQAVWWDTPRRLFGFGA